jgi:hypothetical protein
MENWGNFRLLCSADFTLLCGCLRGSLLFNREIKSTESEEVLVFARTHSTHLQNKMDKLISLCPCAFNNSWMCPHPIYFIWNKKYSNLTGWIGSFKGRMKLCTGRYILCCHSLQFSWPVWSSCFCSVYRCHYHLLIALTNQLFFLFRISGWMSRNYFASISAAGERPFKWGLLSLNSYHDHRFSLMENIVCLVRIVSLITMDQ